ncbi:MAG: hypothetical protein AAFY60_10290 [Myxococcota bacterium]
MRHARVAYEVRRILLPPLLELGLPILGGLILAAAILERSIEPTALGRAIEPLTGPQQALLVGSVLFTYATVLRPAVRRLHYGASLNWLRRLPISNLRWSVTLLPYSLALALPLIVFATVWPSPAWASCAVLGAASHPILLAVGGVGPMAWLWLVLSITFATLGLMLTPGAPAAMAVLSTPIGVQLGAWIYRDLRGRKRATRTGFVPLSWARSRFLNTLLFDLKCLTRTTPGALWASVLGHGVLGALAIGLAVRGQNAGEAWLVALVPSATLGAYVLARLRAVLGQSYFPNRWPLPGSYRVAASAAAAFLPSGSLLLTAAWASPGPRAFILLPALFSLAIAIGFRQRSQPRTLQIAPALLFLAYATSLLGLLHYVVLPVLILLSWRDAIRTLARERDA